jgi:uncharacterized membrane protein YeaQ/YmgE (transglycosylase-associated protein family)
MDIIGVIIVGIVLGLLGKRWLGPNRRDDIGLVTTVACGVLGALVGYALAGLESGAGGVELVRWLMAMLIGSIFVAVMAFVTGRSLSGRL